MGIFNSKEWNAVQYSIDKLLYPFITSDYYNYVLIKSTSYSLGLDNKEIILFFHLLKIEFIMLIKLGAMNYFDEITRLSDPEEIGKIIQHALKFAKENTGLFSWKPSEKAYDLSRELWEQLNKSTSGNGEEQKETINVFHKYFMEVLR